MRAIGAGTENRTRAITKARSQATITSYPHFISVRLLSPQEPRTELLLCPRSFLFRQDSVPAFVISQVVPKGNLAVDPMHRAVKV